MANVSLDKLRLARKLRGGGPKYQQVVDSFTAAIERGDFKPGERIPAEAELVAKLPVSLGTVQKALGRLAASGLLVRNRRTGTFVADRRSQASEAFVYKFRDPDTGEIQLPFVRMLAVEVDTSDGPWRQLLGGTRCVRLDRLVWVASDPPAFTSVYFAYQHGKVLLDVPIEELHGSSAHRVMADRFNLPTLRVEHRICARTLTAKACKELHLRAGTVGIVWDASDFSLGDTPILFQRLQLPPGHRPLEFTDRR